MSHVLCPPQKADAHRQICHPVPLFSPAERLLSWAGLISWSKPDILENVCSGTEQAGIFISRLHLHCFLSWRGVGGGGGRRCGFLVPARGAPRRTLLSSLSSLGSGSSLGLMEAGASRTFERSAQLEDAISNSPPISVECKMCFCVGSAFGKVRVLWRASRCSFRRPRRGASRCAGISPTKCQGFPPCWLGMHQSVSSGVHPLIPSFSQSFVHPEYVS